MLKARWVRDSVTETNLTVARRCKTGTKFFGSVATANSMAVGSYAQGMPEPEVLGPENSAFFTNTLSGTGGAAFGVSLAGAAPWRF